jgi:hypothetical protein
MQVKYKYYSCCSDLFILNISQFYGFNHHSFMHTLELDLAEQEQELLVELALVVDVTNVLPKQGKPRRI